MRTEIVYNCDKKKTMNLIKSKLEEIDGYLSVMTKICNCNSNCCIQGENYLHLTISVNYFSISFKLEVVVIFIQTHE